MKKSPLISFAIPSYNSEKFLHIALESLKNLDDRIEVFIIDDGSKDKTLEIAQEYEKKYPFMHAVHQENKGHGGAINTAISLAKGLYFKVLDSDDWVNEDALKELLEDIENLADLPDLYLMDYTYWHGYENEGECISFQKRMKQKETLTFDKVKSFALSENITLHSSLFKLSVIKASNVTLPEHCFYEDNYFVYTALCGSKTIRYIHKSLYQYLVGREGQSMNRQTLFKRWEMIVLNSELIFDFYDITSLKKTDKGLYRLLKHHLFLFYCMTPFVCQNSHIVEAREGMFAFFDRTKKKNLPQYKIIARNPLFFFISRRGWIGLRLAAIIFYIAHKVVAFTG